MSPLLIIPWIFFQGLHPRVLTEGFDQARAKTLEYLDELKIPIEVEKESLMHVAGTALKTKLHHSLADLLTEVEFKKKNFFLRIDQLFKFFIISNAFF